MMMSKKIAKSALAAALAGGLLAGVAQAYEAGNWLFRIGAYGVFPESDNLNNVPGTAGATLDVDDGYSLGFNFTYMVNPNIGIELLLALPFNHDIKLTGSPLPINGTVADTDQLPPTLSVQYHFTPESSVRPYLGIGLNYTTFFNESTKGALEGTSLKLDDSWGVAGQLGIDIDVAPNWFVNADLRYIGISTDAKLNGVGIGTVDINPWVVGLTVGTRF
jgi:outer membrane protein